MKPRLLDVNLLLALAWPNHTHHQRAQGWFGGVAGRPFATCPLTAAGFVRLSCNPTVTGRPVLVADALALLLRATELPGHVFWPADLPLDAALTAFLDHLGGHRQITDAYLWALAVHHDGVLATFDQGLAGLLPATAAEHHHLEVVAL